MLWSLLVMTFHLPNIHSNGVEVLPNCDCRDWNGGCRASGEEWLDDETWVYSCEGKNGSGKSKFIACQGKKLLIPAGDNQTVDGFWFSCSYNSFVLKYEEEPRCVINKTQYHVGEQFREGFFKWICMENGRWITGCYYQNETKDWILLDIGQTGYNGLVKHTCDRYDDYPGRVQYYAEVRTDIPVKHPTNKGKNQNLPELVDNRLKEIPVRWLHANAATFIDNSKNFISKVRYLHNFYV
ncbi:unnamed protein product [Thelazia callipaeda]|uniref:Ricin B-type lectin domain-containing protein n=1 Tax=Thelazia callipaeda TaxID=103827 RepID=A0A0N5D611_THECL|nr:unnamed protein product [Thelazia callipaeda]